MKLQYVTQRSWPRTPPLIFTEGQKVLNLASFSTPLVFERPAFENAARYPNSETNLVSRDDGLCHQVCFSLQISCCIFKCAPLKDERCRLHFLTLCKKQGMYGQDLRAIIVASPTTEPREYISWASSARLLRAVSREKRKKGQQ